MAYISGGSLSGLYGISSGYGSYGDANVVALLSNYQYPIYVNNSITATGNVSGNVIVGNAFYYGNGVNLVTSLYSNANAQSYLPTYSGLLGGTLIANSQPNVTAVGTLVNLTVGSNVNMAGYAINNLGIPVADTDAVNKQYVDTFAQGLNVKAAVSLTTAGALPGYLYYNGINNDGIGATITGLSLGLLTIDSTTVTVGSRVLVKNETSTNSPYNGIYLCNRNDVGSTFQLERTTDFDTPESIYGGFTYTVAGSTNIGTSWVNTNTCASPITIGTTPITFTQFSAAGTLVGGNAISINTGVINALVDNSTITINGNNQIAATGYLPSLTTNSVISNTILSTGNITGSNVFANATYANTFVANVSISTPSIINLPSLSVSGNITAANFNGNGSNLTGMYGNSNVIAFLPTYAGSLNSVNNITATGTIGANILTANTLAVNFFNGNSINLTGSLTANTLNANANINAGQNITANGYIHSNVDIYAATNITSGNLIYAYGNIDSNLHVTANGHVFSANALLTTGYISATGNIQGSNVITGNVSATANVSAAGNVYAGNIILTANASAAGNITGSYLYGNGFYLTGIATPTGNGVPGGPANSVQLNDGTGNFLGSTNLVYSGNVLSVTGNVAATYFVGTATTAQYADLAEMYAADAQYSPGTVVEIGGTAEIRATSRAQTTSIIGVVSTQPAYLMNSKLGATHPLAVALTGRVPCRVIGTIHKGDLLVSSNTPGVATAGAETPSGSVIGKALEDYNSSTEGVIEVVVGRV